MNPRLAPAFPILLSLLLCGAGCGPEEEEAIPPIRPVRFLEVYSSGGTRVRSFSGVARAGVESRLSFKVRGTIDRLAVDVGDQVAAGQLIATLDPEDYQLQVQDLTATLARYEAEARNAEASYDRIRKLYESNSASRNDLDQARAQYEASTAAVQSTQNKLELAKLQVDHCRLAAPVSGSIAEKRVDVNENVEPGQVVVVLSAGERNEVDVSIPEVLIQSVREGETVEVTFDAMPGRTFLGTITEVGVATVGARPAYPVTVRLADESPEVRPGMAAEVAFKFTADGDGNRILVPPIAVLEDRNGRFVYIVEPGAEAGFGTVRRKPVSIGELTGAGLEITGGLEDGDRVITAGVSKIEDGLTVKFEPKEGGS